MFGRSKFPLETDEKVLVEYHLHCLLRWLPNDWQPPQNLTRQSLDIKRLANPRTDSQPFDYLATLQLVKERLPFPCDDCELIFWDGQAQVPFSPDIILLDPIQQENLDALIARIAFHLSACHWSKVVDQPLLSTCDPVLLYELTPVLAGLGIFCANSALIDESVHDPVESMAILSMQHDYTCQLHSMTVAPPRYFGVALAYLQKLYPAKDTSWKRRLRPDAKSAFQKTLSYLNQSQDCLIHSGRQTTLFDEKEISVLVRQLEKASPSKTYAILNVVLMQLDPNNKPVSDGRLHLLKEKFPGLLRHQDRHVRRMVAQLLQHCLHVQQPSLDAIQELLVDSSACLLYTSPSPRDRTRSRMPSSA